MVSIIEVKTKKQLRCFVDYPNQLYRDVEQFVPATYGDDLEDWDRSKNPAFAYCDARCWLAYRDGEVVGRIGAILSAFAGAEMMALNLPFESVFFNDSSIGTLKIVSSGPATKVILHFDFYLLYLLFVLLELLSFL